MSFNKIIIVGNLGRDPELRYTPQSTPVCSFSVATNEKRKDGSGEAQNITTWFRITLWGRQAEVASKYLTKGSPVYIEGRLRTSEWTDRDGKTRTSLEVMASDLQFIGSRGDAEESSYTPNASPSVRNATSSTTSMSDFDDDMDIGGGANMPDEDIPF
jgi:single-strand DNA-binding protein